MSDYVKMPKADYVAAADAIRSKTGKTDPIKSGELGPKISSLALPTPDPVLQEKTITENGEYTADAGFDGLSKVIVEVAGAGGGGTLVGAQGTFTGASAAQTITHNLGVIPLAVVCWATTGMITTNAIDRAVRMVVGFGPLFKTVTSGIDRFQHQVYWNKDRSSYDSGTQMYTIDEASGLINNANTTTVVIGNGTYKPYASTHYTWVAVGYKTE